MQISIGARLTLSAIMITGLFGCTSYIHSEYDKKITQSLGEISNWNQQSKANKLAPVKITELIDIKELDALIEEAMQNNPGLKQSLLALKIAKKENEQAWASLYPEADLTLGANKEKNSSKEFTSQLSVSWEIDIWNKVGDGIAGAKETLKAEQASLEEVKNVLAADIMRQWLLISANKQYLQIENKRLDALVKNEEFIKERYIRGLGNLEDLDTAKTRIASSRAQIEKYKEAVNENERSLVSLIGKFGLNKNLVVPTSFPEVLVPVASMPEQDLANRPDLKEAYSKLKVSQYSENVAYKDMLPSISLSASMSDSASSPVKSLFKDPLWNLLGNISAPLFRGGELKSEAEISSLKVQQSYWAYQETLLNAVTEVEDSLDKEVSLGKQQVHLNDAYLSAKRSEDNYQNKYESGLVEILDLLSAQQTTYDAEIQLVQAKYNRLVNRIDLGLALGLGV